LRYSLQSVRFDSVRRCHREVVGAQEAGHR